jgi:hypothetical protein
MPGDPPARPPLPTHLHRAGALRRRPSGSRKRRRSTHGSCRAAWPVPSWRTCSCAGRTWPPHHPGAPPEPPPTANAPAAKRPGPSRILSLMSLEDHAPRAAVEKKTHLQRHVTRQETDGPTSIFRIKNCLWNLPQWQFGTAPPHRPHPSPLPHLTATTPHCPGILFVWPPLLRRCSRAWPHPPPGARGAGRLAGRQDLCLPFAESLGPSPSLSLV